MKITIFISALSGGGAERVTCNLANFLIKKGHKIDVLTMGEALPAEPLLEGVKEIPLLRNSERRNIVLNFFKRVFRLRAYMKKETVDAYVVFLPVLTRLMLSFSNLTKAPIIMSERADPKVYPKKVQKHLRKVCKKSSGAIFQTNETAQWYAPHLKGVKYKVIPNAINPAFIRPQFNEEREKIIVGVGRFSAQKNFPLLIRAFSKIANEYPEYKLVLYGKGALLESYKQLAEELKIIDRIEFPGYVPDMPERLEKASMFVLSSNYEGMPNALMEAMALGLPVVSTDCGGGGAKFLIENEKNGLLVPQRDEEAMANAMRKILADNNFAASLGIEARKLQETLAPEKIYGEWEEFIKTVIKI